MFRSAVLRSTAAAVRTASMRPMSTTARRAAIAAAAPRITLAAAPRAVAWQAVRCYSAAGGLEKKDVYERIKLLLSGFDKVNDPSNITEKAHFANDLGLDSLDTVEVVMAIEEVRTPLLLPRHP
ncbi:hypothetical protein B0T18DRAFT_409330 [Schizothecium vesticola]|uniref:Acyl carrier protein n=1 Tax=Schizothecium vesticola TaxID=314040 RepID=A0AA40F3Z6_9PEZI|nr:hypothetical protein B0T18DRAFT_409330 [Schizothecium vesticola]